MQENKNIELPKRKRTRLIGYDYSQDGFYFVTICSHEHRQVFSRIVGRGLAPAENHLSAYGLIAKKQLLALEERYPHIRIHKYVIMPNHIHLMISIHAHSAGASPCPTLSDVICTFKSLTARECRRMNPLPKVFQNSFHDHIIRGEADYRKNGNTLTPIHKSGVSIDIIPISNRKEAACKGGFFAVLLILPLR